MCIRDRFITVYICLYFAAIMEHIGAIEALLGKLLLSVKTRFSLVFVTSISCVVLTLSLIHIYILRHTFCTRLANKNMNPKSLQYIMGHSNINITLNLYAHASLDGVKAELVSLIA